MGLIRAIDPALLEAISGPVWYPILLVDLDWPGARVRAHSGSGPLTFGGNAYLGVGRFGAISSPSEGFGLAASGVSLSLAGLPPDVLDEANDPIRNREALVYIGATTSPAGNVLIGEPYLLLAGYMDALRYSLRREDGGLEHMLQLDIGVGPSARSSAVVLHSAEDQARFSGDTAGRHLIEIEKRVTVLKWPED